MHTKGNNKRNFSDDFKKNSKKHFNFFLTLLKILSVSGKFELIFPIFFFFEIYSQKLNCMYFSKFLIEI